MCHIYYYNACENLTANHFRTDLQHVPPSFLNLIFWHSEGTVASRVLPPVLVRQN